VWDETVVLEAKVAQSIVVARRSGARWYLAAMNGDAAASTQVPLKFLGAGQWTLRSFADKPDASDYSAVVETRQTVDAATKLPLALCPAGGFVAVIAPK